MTRKTKTALITVCLLLTVTVVYALAAAGGASDPLASLSYLTGTFTDAVDQRVEEKLDASDQALLNGDAAPSDSGAATWTETRLKAGDALTGSTGTGVLLLAGGMQVTFNSGAVVDVTTGTPVTSGSAITASHRYLVAEETTAVFTVTSKTAVVDYQGPYAFSYSTNTDYNAIAAARKTMHLFQGSFTGYGDGYDLEVAPTRLQALIMFIRVLGEENDALAYTGSTPFTDITPGTQSEKYGGYAYSKGYTNGVDAKHFGPNNTVSAAQFLTFLLRALGYKDGTDFTWDSPWPLTDRLGISNGDYNATTKTFLRADAAALSASTLYAKKKGSDKTLLKDLLDNGAISGSTVVIWDYDAVAFQEDYASFLFYPVSGSPATFTSFKLDIVSVNGLSCQTLQVTTPEAVAAYLASIGHKTGGFGYVEITYDEEAAAKAATEYYTAANGKKYPLIAFTFTYTATEASGKQQKGTFTDYYYFDA